MKQVLLLAFILLTITGLMAQETITPAKNEAASSKNLAASGKCAVAGIITDMHNFPLKGVKAFVYQADSSIIASGFTDADGYFETNSILPGTYYIRIMYPSQTITLIMNVTMKPGITPVNIKAEPPAADNTISYSDIAPKPSEKKKIIK